MGNILAFIKQLKDGGLENIDDKYQIFLDFENENLDFNDLREDEKALAGKIEEKLKTSHLQSPSLSLRTKKYVPPSSCPN